MLQVPQLRENTKESIEKLTKKNYKDAELAVTEIIRLDDARKAIQTNLDNLLAEQNNLAAQIGELFKQGKKDEADVLKQKTLELKEQSKSLGNDLAEAEKNLYDQLVLLPNLPHASVPFGKTPQDQHH